MFLSSFHTLTVLLRQQALLLVSGICFALGTATAVAQTPDYVKVYHPVINQAELSIVAEAYGPALEAYQQAFAAVPSPFARDYYNAAICALLVQDEKQTYHYLQKLVEKGVSVDYLERQPLLDSLAGTKNWKKFNRKSKKYRRIYKRHVNLDLRADLDELYARDQYFRQAQGGLRVYGDTLRKIETSNVEQMLAWVEKYGYPGEDVVGLADTLEQLPRFSIVIQRQTKARKGYDFTPILQEAVHQGRLLPHAAAYLLEQQQGKSTYGAKVLFRVNCSTCEKDKKLKHLGQYMVADRSKKELANVAAQREELGLEPLKDYRKKVVYSLRDNRFKLSYDWSVVNYYVPSNEAAKVMLENLAVLK
ncbi:hypothetical protein [Pontibacter liquoris]|uniref:hypothetical protein n=1 Tax=Pontibacter liquoris TaxID=2905677 RepID=UPI001FA775E1|nr:hypothetical protein [Pontibacter liquoris]